MKYTLLIYFSSLITITICSYYVGMFKKNDLLVAQDNLFKPRVPFRVQYAKYGRVFKCPITYIRVSDRLGMGKGPRVEVVRGGLQKKYVVLRLSTYNMPISVNVYIGCENKMTTTQRTTVETTPDGNDTDRGSDDSKEAKNATSDEVNKGNGTDEEHEPEKEEEEEAE